MGMELCCTTHELGEPKASFCPEGPRDLQVNNAKRDLSTRQAMQKNENDERTKPNQGRAQGPINRFRIKRSIDTRKHTSPLKITALEKQHTQRPSESPIQLFCFPLARAELGLPLPLLPLPLSRLPARWNGLGTGREIGFKGPLFSDPELPRLSVTSSDRSS